jgi:hypothetical protein
MGRRDYGSAGTTNQKINRQIIFLENFQHANMGYSSHCPPAKSYSDFLSWHFIFLRLYFSKA